MADKQPMTTAGFFTEAKRLNLRAPMSHADMCAAFDAKDAEIAKLRQQLAGLTEPIAWAANWVRDRIADHIETAWPHAEMWTPAIAENVRSITIIPPAHRIEAAAKAIAACMDYPWDHMPEQGKQSMRQHARTVAAALIRKEATNG